MKRKSENAVYTRLVDNFQNSGTLFRVLGVLVLLLGIHYLLWRYFKSINMNALWYAIPLVIAETYGFVTFCLTLVQIWRPITRQAPEWDRTPSVDVYITTYNEDPALVKKTAQAAMQIKWREKQVFILDDGNRDSVQQMARKIGCSYIRRGEEWQNKPRHAKAGNVNNALLQTAGEFILILDADQIPEPDIISAVIGYFKNPAVAFVQTPQAFYNMPHNDPFGTDSLLFYGPIMLGKDSWNAAFFCGSNAILRRESLMQVGLIRYVENTKIRMITNIKKLKKQLKTVRLQDKKKKYVLKDLIRETGHVQRMLKTGLPFEKCSDYLNTKMQEALSALSGKGISELSEVLEELTAAGDMQAKAALEAIHSSLSTIQDLASDTSLLDVSGNVLEEINLTTPDEAIPVQALATESVTEDMATAMLLHSHGWQSVFHPEILARGLAPEDLGSSLGQRFRWAQGTIQVLKNENPLTLKGLSLPQRLMYFTTIFSYFSGFFNLILLLSPIVFLFTGVAPITEWSAVFFINFLPFFIMNKVLFKWMAKDISLWRGEQYSTALFPLWIKAILSVYTGRKISFVVTPKERRTGSYLHMVIPQILIIVLTAAAILFYMFYKILPGDGNLIGFIVNSYWGIYNITLLSSIVRAAVYKPEEETSGSVLHV